jgi:hypothetical protein
MVLFSRLRVNLAMSSHSAANLKNFSDGSSMGWVLPVLVSCLPAEPQSLQKVPIDSGSLAPVKTVSRRPRPVYN